MITVASLDIHIDGFPSIIKKSQPNPLANFLLRSCFVLDLSWWVPEPIVKKLMGSQEPMEPMLTEPLITIFELG